MGLIRQNGFGWAGVLALSVACGSGEVRGPQTSGPTLPDARATSEWAADFPSESDYAIVLGVLDDPVVQGSMADAQGQPLLPQWWVSTVSDAYLGTDVDDALALENFYDQWRLVSIRVSPCAPLGVAPYQDIDQLCWPTVRLVWQPVVEDLRLLWGVQTDFYADDRAIHAIYPLAARERDGSLIGGGLRQEVAGYLKGGALPYVIPNATRAAFSEQRDSTADWLIGVVHWLRESELRQGSYSGFGVRPELMVGGQVAADFESRLTAFLAELAQNQYLDELTSFSLPEGRMPGSADSWVFVGFDGNEGSPRLKSLSVIGRESGRELINIGLSQTVAVGGEDAVIEEALERGNPELRDSLIITGDDIASMTEDVADPYEFLVPNTSCGSCHRMNNDLRFNFHAFSGFENDGTTVSRRVERDVARDIAWTLGR